MIKKEEDKQFLFHQLLEEICTEENIKIQFFSSNWIMVLEKGQERRVIAGYKFDHNGHGAGLVFDDKAALSEILSFYHIPNVMHHVVYPSSNLEVYAKNYNNMDYLKKLFNKYHNNVVLKPNNGTTGMGVSHITTLKDLEEKFSSLTSEYGLLSLCPYYEIENEYRAIMLNGEILVFYQKERPVVVGDGVSSIKELLEKFNYEYFKDYEEENKDMILKKGEKYIYNWCFNLSGGAKANLDVCNDIRRNVSLLAKQVADVTHLGFGSVDIIRTKDNQYFVMEINSGVMMEKFMKKDEEGYKLAKEVYRKAIESLFSK